MKIHSGIAPIQGLKNAVVTSGTFDGVHIGHQKILERLKQAAKEIDGETVLITYWPHPRLVLSDRTNGLRLLSTFPEKANLLEQYGIDHLVKVPFTKEFAQLSSQEYIKTILHDTVSTKKLIIGYDHRFGKNRQGGLEDLQKFAPKYGYDLEEIPRQDIDEIGVSSTRIRKALEEEDVREANQYLGRPYSLTGLVMHGNKLGRTIGFPTANIGIKEPYKLLPSNGIYAIKINYDFKIYNGMLNIGNRPTVGGTKKTIEAHIFDFNEEIYDQEITVEFIDHIRNEIKFDGLEGLKVQLQEDEIACREALKVSK
jgi:riboflavin kinase / FMN adenylyltransferase